LSAGGYAVFLFPQNSGQIHLVPIQFDLYPLAERRDATGSAKLFHPRARFRTDTEAVCTTAMASVPLSREHDMLALRLIREEEEHNAG
jgi:hypothetical protein